MTSKNGDDEESTPPQLGPPSPHEDVVRTLQNLSMSLNGVAGRLVDVARNVRKYGISPDVRQAVGEDLRGLSSQFLVAAAIVDPK